MSDGIYAALSGAVAQERALDVVANNVANVGTDGFRGDRLAFRESLSRATGGPTPTSLRYVEVGLSRIDDTEGPMRATGNPLDLAIGGDAFFVVDTPNGMRLTRDGSFAVDTAGVLRTHGGHAVMQGPGPQPSPIVLTDRRTPITVSPEGVLSQGDQLVAQLRFERFAAQEDARHEGLSLLVPQQGTQTLPATGATVMQGYLEGANVSAVGGMNELITTNRSFEAFQRVIQTFRALDERTARELASAG